MIANTTIRAISRTGAKRAMSDTPGPKMHKAKDAWKTIHATRPVDPHPHNVFHPPYNKVTSAVAVCSVVGLGYGVMYSGLRHQQKKQGYWK
eukprot:scaffold10203_cov272-Chaetoceros_neogracile.AAC.28